MTLLRRFDAVRDGPSLHAIYGDEESCRFLLAPATPSVDETVALLARWNVGAEETTWAVVERDHGEALGRISFFRVGDEGVWGAGCMIVPAARGRNLAARALAEAIPYMFGRQKARRLFADIDPDNSASIRVFERLGFCFEGRHRAAWNTHLGVRDSLIYSLLDTDPHPRP